MKMQFLICAITAGVLSLSAQDSNLKTGLHNDFPQTVRWSYWDEGWHADKTVTFSYNPLGLPLSEVWDRLEGVDVKFTYAYASDNLHQTLTLTQEKSGGIWTNINRQRREYDANGSETLMVREYYTGGVWMIESGFQYQPEYLEGRLYKTTIASFNPADGYFHPATRCTYTWDESGKLKGKTCENFSEAGTWVSAIRNSYFWTHDNLPDYVMSDIWRVNEWVPYSKEMHSYYGLENHSETLYIWREDLQVYSAWQKLVSEFDERSNLILGTTGEWLAGGWQVSSGNRYGYTYTDGKATERISERWDPVAPEGGASGGKWIMESREVFSDFMSLGSNDIIRSPLQLHCYPNPANDILFVNFTNEGGAAAELIIRDTQGRILIKQRTGGGDSQFSVSVSKIPPGVYWLTINNGKHLPASQKIIRK